MTKPTQALRDAVALAIVKSRYDLGAPATEIADAILAEITAAAEVGNKGKCVAAHMGGKRCVGRCMMSKDCCETPLPAAAEVGEIMTPSREPETAVIRPERDAVSPTQAQIEAADGFKRTIKWPDPTPEMLASPQFEAIWQCIKRWDINVPDAYSGYMGANGNHVRAILDVLAAAAEVGEHDPRDDFSEQNNPFPVAAEVGETNLKMLERWDAEDAEIMRQLLHEREAATIERCLLAVDTEEEAPGDMPAELRSMPLEDVIRAAIRATKKSISRRIMALKEKA